MLVNVLYFEYFKLNMCLIKYSSFTCVMNINIDIKINIAYGSTLYYWKK